MSLHFTPLRRGLAASNPNKTKVVTQESAKSNPNLEPKSINNSTKTKHYVKKVPKVTRIYERPRPTCTTTVLELGVGS